MRIVVPLVVLIAGIGVAILAAQTNPKKQSTTAANNTPDSQVQPPETGVDSTDSPEQVQPDESQADPTATPDDNETTNQPDPGGKSQAIDPTPLTVRTLETQPDLPILGSLDADSGYEIEAILSPYGLGIESLRLTGYFETLEDKEHVLVQKTREIDTGGIVSSAVPFALTAVIVNGQRLDLTSGPKGEPVWTHAPDRAPGAFNAIVETDDGTPVVLIERTISVAPDSHVVEIHQRAVNLSKSPVTVEWIHSGPITLGPDTGGYGGDKRRLRFGYWLNPKSQAGDTAVLSSKYTTPFRSLVGLRKENGAYVIPLKSDLWPNTKSEKAGDRLVWFGLTQRYFGVAFHPLIDPAGPNRLFPVQRVTRVAGLEPGTPINASRGELTNKTVVLTLIESESRYIAPGGAASFDVGLFAGPLSRPVINAEPLPEALGLQGLVLYNFGGMCAFCTFQPLAHLLLAILHLLHTITGDWAIGIIILVIIVRTCLHPVTRWSQIKMQRFGAQMQGIAPKQKKIKEKYGDDPKRMQQEMTKLWREEGINPAGMLGCLPMLLQSPVWIALYATLFFAVELRHQPAFYGVFQSAFGGWQFLADLSRSDNAIPLGKGFSLFGVAHIDAINVLPLMMGFVFYFHQKYLTPPTTTSLSPEQESTQKMVKIMSVFLFPIFMYAAPSGLALYFVTNSSLAIIENKWIRAHMNKHGLLDPDKIRESVQAKREARQTGGFMARLKSAAADQQKQQEASKRMMRRVKNVAPERTEPNYKKKPKK
jgi:YidC/Oxa1 family membrane protein insertase